MPRRRHSHERVDGPMAHERLRQNSQTRLLDIKAGRDKRILAVVRRPFEKRIRELEKLIFTYRKLVEKVCTISYHRRFSVRRSPRFLSTMSFGFSLGDFVIAIRLAAEIYEKCFTRAQGAGEPNDS